MSLNDCGDLVINEYESNDRSLTEWNFGNSLKYLTDENAESSLDVNDVNLELVQPDIVTQNSKTVVKSFRDSQESRKGIKLSSQKDNVRDLCTLPFTISNSKIPTPYYQKKEKITNSIGANCNECVSVLEDGLHISDPYLNTNLESNGDIKDFSVTSNSSHKGILVYRNKNMSDENLNLPSYPNNENKNNKENPLRRYYSTLSLKEPNTNSKVSMRHPSHSSISKSRSLSNLSTFKSPNYDNIQSKVKKYIQEQKRESKLRRDSKPDTKSLPVTPVKSIASRGLLDLDENYLDKLCLSSKKQKEDLPEDLKKIKQEILKGNVDINIVEKLFNKLEKEREYRINQDIFLNAFQLHYDNLLGKYAEAKNDIDYLRFNKDTNNSGEYSQASKLSNFKKAFSTSNIVAECSMPYEFESAKPSSNLVRYSSTPQVHQEIAEESQENFEEKLSHLSESFINENSLSASSTSFKGDVNDWIEKFNYLRQKLKEYVILEKNLAFNKGERKTVWKYILKLYSKLYKALPPESSCKFMLEEMHKSINAVAGKYSLHFPQNFPSNDDSKNAKTGSGFCENLPTNSSYPKLAHESLCQDKLDFSKPDYSVLTNNSRTNDKSKSSFLRYSNARDADSGCPPSDRSTRNSHFPSFDPLESLSLNGIENEVSLNSNECKSRAMGYGEVWRGQSIDNLLQISDNGRNIKWNSRKKYCLKNSRSKSLMNLDENYDASGSSEFEDSVGNDDNKTRKYVRKKSAKSPKTTKYLGRYEDKFICQDQFVSSDSHSSKYDGNKCILDMSQMEKNSKYFEYQVKDLKSKGLLRKRNDRGKRYSLPNRPNTPLKALANEPLKLARMSLGVNDLPNTSSVSSEKQLAVKRQLSTCSIFSGKSNGTENEGPKLYNEDSFLFPPKSRNKLLGTSTPKSSFHNFEKSDYSAQSKERYSLSSDLSFKSKKSSFRCCMGDSEVQANSSTISVPHRCNMKPYVVVCCCHSNQLPKSHCSRASCEHRSSSASSANTEVDSEKLMTYLNKVTEKAESVRMDTQASLNLFRSKMLPVTRR